MSEKKGSAFSKTLIIIFLAVWALIVLFPFYWMVLTSVKNTASYNNEKTPEFITMEPTGENYVTAFTEVSLGRYFANTLIFTVATTGLMMLVIVPASAGRVRSSATTPLQWKAPILERAHSLERVMSSQVLASSISAVTYGSIGIFSSPTP